jgi:hypothetical protein
LPPCSSPGSPAPSANLTDHPPGRHPSDRSDPLTGTCREPLSRTCRVTGSPTLSLDQLIEEGDTVVAVGTGEMTLKLAGRVAFVFTEIFIFTGDRISRLETFHINLGGPADTLFTAPAADEAG